MNCELLLSLSDKSVISKATITEFIEELFENKFITCESDIKLSFRYYDETADCWLGEEFTPSSKDECIDIINNNYKKQIDIDFLSKNQYGDGPATSITPFISEINDISSTISNQIDSYYSPNFYLGAGFRSGTFYNEGGPYEQSAFYIRGESYPDDESIYLEQFNSFADSKSEKYIKLKNILETCYKQNPELWLEAEEG